MGINEGKAHCREAAAVLSTLTFVFIFLDPELKKILYLSFLGHNLSPLQW